MLSGVRQTIFATEYDENYIYDRITCTNFRLCQFLPCVVQDGTLVDEHLAGPRSGQLLGSGNEDEEEKEWDKPVNDDNPIGLGDEGDDELRRVWERQKKRRLVL